MHGLSSNYINSCLKKLLHTSKSFSFKAGSAAFIHN